MKCETYVEEAVEPRAEDEDVLRVLNRERPRVARCELLRVVRRVRDERRGRDGVRLEVRLFTHNTKAPSAVSWS